MPYIDSPEHKPQRVHIFKVHIDKKTFSIEFLPILYGVWKQNPMTIYSIASGQPAIRQASLLALYLAVIKPVTFNKRRLN